MMATEQTRSLTQSILSTPSALNPPSPTLCISLYVRRCYGVNHLMTARRVAFMCACVCESACACVGMPSVSQVRHARCSVHKTCSGIRELRFSWGWVGKGGWWRRLDGECSRRAFAWIMVWVRGQMNTRALMKMRNSSGWMYLVRLPVCAYY